MDWAALETEYITTSISLRALADKHGVGQSKLKKRSTTEKWADKRNQYRTKSVQKTIEKASDLTSEARAILHEAALTWAKRLLEYTPEEVENLKWKPKDITGALKDCVDILGVKSDDDIKEQSARIAKLEREAAEQNDTKDIRVVIEGAGDGWQS
jgi:hypothetical protein